VTEGIYIILILLLTWWSGFFSSSEIALFSLPSATVRSYESSSNTRKRLVAKLLKNPRSLLVTIYMMNTLVNILLQNVTSSMFGTASSMTLRVGVPLLITLILGEIIPKYLAMQYNSLISVRIAKLMDLISRWIRPLREWTVKVTTPISRIMFFFLKTATPMTKEEIKHVLDSCEASGVLNEDETRLIYGYVNLQDAQIKDHMKPREDVLYYNTEEPLSKLIYLFVEEECSRLPVCEGNLDDVRGILHANDFFLYKPMLKEPKDVFAISSKPLYAPESTPARLLMRELAEKGEKVALVVDEHRSVSGLISIEDLIEEVVGEISDRRTQMPLYEISSTNTIIANAKLELADFEKLTEIRLISEHNMNTLGGWLTEQLGDIPSPGTSFVTDEFHFKVLEADPNRIKRIFVRRKERT
jgi:putative hemolysin